MVIWHGGRAARLSLLTFLAFFGGCALLYPVPPAPQRYEGFPLPNFDRVADGVYRGAQPTGQQFALLVQRYEVKTVFKLNHGTDRVPRGVSVIHHPVRLLWRPSGAQDLRDLLDAIDSAEKPLFIHCTKGMDRTGLVVALYKIRHGTSVNDAYADMVRHGFHPYRGVWLAWLRDSGWAAPPAPSRSAPAPDATTPRPQAAR